MDEQSSFYFMAKLNDITMKNTILDSLQDDYNSCIDNSDNFISCKSLLENMLDEAKWDPRDRYPHYYKHVCTEEEEYTGTEDESGRIKFPNIPIGKYLSNAEKLADAQHIKDSQTDDGVFGWKSKFGWMRGEVSLKFRKSNYKDSDGNYLYEYVAYRPIFGNKQLKKDYYGTSVTYSNIVDRLVFSYGLSRNPEKNFKKESSLDLDEFKESLIKITESLLTEANRQQLLQKSRNAQNYSIKNQAKGKNRYDRRNKSSISATVRDYNMIQMDPLFKRDILEFKIPVIGETDVYVVDVRVDGLLAEVRKQVMANKGKLEFKVVLQSLMKVLNIGNVYIGCNCPDAIYRQAYWQTQDNYKAGYKERRPSNITNPNDTLGAGCKHVLLILANLDWAVKVASVINNYIKYCKEHLQNNYAEYIFPKVYGVKYDKAVQLQLFDTGLFPDDVKTMNDVIDQGFRGKDRQGKFIKGNDMRFKKSDLQSEPSQEDENPLELDLTDETETEVTSEE